MIGGQCDDVKLQVTVREKPGGDEESGGHIYENILVCSATASSTDPKKAQTSNGNFVGVMSPFDENAEWAEIADIFASFGSGMARESVFIRDMEEKFASSLSLGKFVGS